MTSRKSQYRAQPSLGFAAASLGALLICGGTALAQPRPAQTGQTITTNFKDADITQIAEAVSAATGKNFIIDPRVRAQVTMLSSTPMSPPAFYEAFLAILQVHGFAAMPAGNVVKIVPDSSIRSMPGVDLPDNVSATSDEIVTQVISVKNVSAAQLVPVLRPLVPQQGQLAAYVPSNILIISDHASNVNRIVRIVRRIDQVGDSTVEVLNLQNASAAEIVRIVTSLYQAQQGQEAAGATPTKLVADERSNSVLVSGDQAQRLRIRALVAHLDTPLETGGDTQVRYLRYADAEKIATKLKEQVTGVTQAAAPTGAAGGSTPQAQAEKGTTIWADPQTNALIITAPPKTMRSLMGIIDKLDIRRAQVLVEAIIVDVSQDKSAQLGVNWAIFSKANNTQIPAASFSEPVGGSSIVDLLPAAVTGDITQVPSSALIGTTIGIGRFAAGGVNFASIIKALRGDANTNIIATPSTVTMDNQEAELKVAQEVPFITGQYANTTTTSTGTSTNAGVVNPFQTIQREEVGTIVKVTPQINEGDSVVLKIGLESSNIASSSQGAVDLITNKRTISTTVLIEDGGIVVMGGLIQDSGTKSEQRVPFLGAIPIIGLAFKTRAAQNTKTNLMFFIRPKILRDGVSAAIETNSKYNYIRDQQRAADHYEILPLLPGVGTPKLPPAPPMPANATPAPTTPAQKERESKQVTPPADSPAKPSTDVAPPPAGTPPLGEPPLGQPPPGPKGASTDRPN